MAQTEKQLANLMPPWQKGQTGNPNGPPLGTQRGLRSRFRQMLDKIPAEDILKVLKAKGIEVKDNAQVISYAVGRKAMKGDIAAAKLIAEQTEIPLPKAVEMTGADGGPIDMKWTVEIVDAEKHED